MNDSSNELYAGTPDDVDEERKEQIRREMEAREREIAELEALQQKPAQKSQATQPEAKAPAAAQPTQQPQTTKETPQEKEDFYGVDTSFQDDGIDPSVAQVAAEGVLSPFVGATDFVVDAINLIPNVDLPKIPKFENDVTQSVRELSSIVLPTIGLGAFGGGKLALAGKASKVKFLQDPFVKWLGNTSFQAGTGAFVDYTVEFNEEDDNLAGVLRANLPQQLGWLPSNLATMDGDSPDTIRAKNVMEGVYLGVGLDVLLGVAQIVRRAGGFETKYLPKSETSGAFFERYNKEVPPNETPEDFVNRQVTQRETATTEVGQFNYEKSIDLNGVERALDEPMWGVHDYPLYGYQESGIRSADPGGIALAGSDYSRIVRDMGSTNGRVRSIATESFIKSFNDGKMDNNILLRGMKDDMLSSGEYDVKLADGNYLTAKQIIEDGEELAARHYTLSLPQLKQLFNSLATEESGELGVRTLSSTGMEGARKMIQKYLDDFVNMDLGRAEAYLETSVAGQVSDTAMGMRLVEGTPAIERAQEQILDRLQLLMAMRGRAAYVRGRALNMTNTWNRLKMTKDFTDINKMEYAKRVEKSVKEEKNDTLRMLRAIEQDAAITIDTLREVSQKNPNMLAPLMMAYEFTDGNVDTIAKLNRFLAESTGTIRKAMIDNAPDVPSVIVNGFYSNLYNSTLSAAATPIRAAIGNLGGLVEKPIGNFVGALVTGDRRLIRRGMFQYFSDIEGLQNAFGYMKQVFRRSATEPNVDGLLRDDVFIRNDKQIEVLNAFADAKAESGDFGPQLMMQQVNAMNDLAKHPWLRFGTRAMQALDGFTQSMIAHAEAKGRAFDEITNFGRREFDADGAQKVYDKVYSEMFNKDGLITDEAVRFTSGEIALNLDNEYNNALSTIIRRAPVLKPFLLFTKTPLNATKVMLSYTPMGSFVKGLNDFRLPVEQMSDEAIADLLTKRGIKIDTGDPQAFVNKYNEIRADLKGREALGTLAVIAAGGLVMSDRVTGNGLYNKQKQGLRRDVGWKPRSIRVPGGEWVSYDGLGPVTDWIAMVADIFDNFDSLSPNDAGEQVRKMAFVFGASFTDKTYLAGLEPFLDVLRGDVGAINKWSASFISSSTLRGSSMMAELARAFEPGLKEVENDIFNLVQNRLPIAKGTLPQVYDYIDGSRVGDYDGDIAGFFNRVINTYTPFKISGKRSELKQFLIDIEYDGRPNLSTNGRNVRLTTQEQSDIASKMGEMGYFKSEIERIMKTTDGKAFRKAFNEAQATGHTVDLRQFRMLHMMIDDALRTAVEMARVNIPGADALTRRADMLSVTTDMLKTGDTAALKKFQEENRKLGVIPY
jgi:DNA-nicking Smr family endonuclease